MRRLTIATLVALSTVLAAGEAQSRPQGHVPAIVSQEAAKAGVPQRLAHAVIRKESGYDCRARNRSGAAGAGQLMPATARGLGVHDAFDPEQAVNGAAQYLSQLLKEFKTVPLALAAYNAGGGNVRKYDGIPPFAETQAYVPKVQKALAALGG